MKKAIKSRWHSLLLVPVVAMFFFAGSVNAQNAAQNTRQGINKAQRFNAADTNRDGLVSQSEYRFGNFAQFDANRDGNLSRKEYRKMNKALKKNNVGSSNRGMKKGNGQGVNQNKRRGNGTGQGINQAKGRGNGTGVCPNSAAGNNRTGTRGRRGG